MTAKQRRKTLIMKNYQAILFDLDGTLVESGPGIINSIKTAFERMHRPVPSKEELRVFIGPPSRVTFPKFGIPQEEVETAVSYYRERYWKKGQYECSIYPGIENLLEQLKAEGYRLFVATSKPEVTAKNMLDYLGLSNYFEVIAGATYDHVREKKSQVIRYLFAEAEISASDAVLIGDTMFDVNGANEVGIPTICVSWGYGDEEEMLRAGAAAVVHSTEELKHLL